MYTFLETQPGETNYQLFTSVPSQVYPYYKRQLAQKNEVNSEFLVKCLVLLKDGQAVGRVGIYDNPSLQYKDHRIGGIGNYECIEDMEASRVLLNKAVMELTALGVEYILGPINGSTWDDYSFITHHAHPNFFLEPFNPVYYNAQFQAFGFELAANRVSSIDRNLEGRYSSVEEKELQLAKTGVTFRSIRLEAYEEELEAIYPFMMESFRTHQFFSPIQKETFLAKFRPFRDLIDPDFVLIAEDQTEKMVGLFFCIQDFLNLEEKCLVSKTVARASGEAWRGLGDVMLSRMYERARNKGFQAMIYAFMNPAFNSRLSAEYAGETYKTYALYGLSVQKAVKPSVLLARKY
ncbi:MAG: hypothetical protein AAF587_36870 [Bacteroidota bacterium]